MVDSDNFSLKKPIFNSSSGSLLTSKAACKSSDSGARISDITSQNKQCRMDGTLSIIEEESKCITSCSEIDLKNTGNDENLNEIAGPAELSENLVDILESNDLYFSVDADENKPEKIFPFTVELLKLRNERGIPIAISSKLRNICIKYYSIIYWDGDDAEEHRENIFLLLNLCYVGHNDETFKVDREIESLKTDLEKTLVKSLTPTLCHFMVTYPSHVYDLLTLIFYLLCNWTSVRVEICEFELKERFLAVCIQKCMARLPSVTEWKDYALLIWTTFSRLLLPETEWVHPNRQILPISPPFWSDAVKIDNEVKKLLELIFIDCRLHLLWSHLNRPKSCRALFKEITDVDTVFQEIFRLLNNTSWPCEKSGRDRISWTAWEIIRRSTVILVNNLLSLPVASVNAGINCFASLYWIPNTDNTSDHLNQHNCISQLMIFSVMSVDRGANPKENAEISSRIEDGVLSQVVPALINYMMKYPNHTYQNISSYWRLVDKWPSAVERISGFEQTHPQSILEPCLKHIINQPSLWKYVDIVTWDFFVPLALHNIKSTYGSDYPHTDHSRSCLKSGCIDCIKDLVSGFDPTVMAMNSSCIIIALCLMTRLLRIQSLTHLDSASTSAVHKTLAILKSLHPIEHIRDELLQCGIISALKSSLYLMEEYSWHYDAKNLAIEIIELLELFSPGVLNWNDFVDCWLVKGCSLLNAEHLDTLFSSDIYWFGMQVLRIASKTRPWCDTIWDDSRVISRFLSWLGLSKLPVKMTWRLLYSMSER